MSKRHPKFHSSFSSTRAWLYVPQERFERILSTLHGCWPATGEGTVSIQTDRAQALERVVATIGRPLR